MERIFIACLLTVVIETAFFLLAGFRSKSFVTVCVCVNAATNLSLNLIIWLLYRLGVDLTVAVYPLEAIVVAVEYLVYAALDGFSGKLFLLTLSANLISYCSGLLLFGHA